MAIEYSTFSDEENQQIFTAVQDFVSAGEESIVQAECYRIQILANAKNFLFRPSPSAPDVEIARLLMHEAKVMGEAIRQARAVLQFKGLDDRSTLDRIAGQHNLR